MAQPLFQTCAFRKDCRNLDANCALYAAQGECRDRKDDILRIQASPKGRTGGSIQEKLELP